MNLTLEQAMAKATKGSLYVGSPIRSADTLGINVSGMDGEEPWENTIAEVLPGCGPEKMKAEAALLAHWYNVGPELVKELQNCLAEWERGTGYDRQDEVRSILARANTVTIPD